MGHYTTLAGILLAGMLLHGCVSPGSQVIDWPADLPARVLLDSVPHNRQHAYYCGPAALASTLQFSGVDIDSDTLARQTYLPARQGSLQLELIAAARSHGRLAYPLAPDVDAVLHELAAGNPVLVLQNLAFAWWPLWHYAVITGYDQTQRSIFMHSGNDAHRQVDAMLFLRTWRRAGSWSLLTLRPGALPSTATPLGLARAVADLEQLGQLDLAQLTLSSALQRWPDQALMHFAAGNVYFARGELQAAINAFAAVLNIDSSWASAWNNLAYSFATAHCPGEAQAAARCASVLQPGSPPIAISTGREDSELNAIDFSCADLPRPAEGDICQIEFPPSP